MGFIGFIGMCFCIAMTFETNNTDFLILAGLIFIGTCILELPRMIFNKIQKLTDSLNKIIQNQTNKVLDEDKNKEK